MARYVDGFVIPIPKKNVDAYRKMARLGGKIWIEHGALDYVECVGDDLKTKGIRSFPDMADAKRGETVIFAWIVYKSKAHRDRVNAKVMADPRMKEPEIIPFEIKKMAFGGFKTIVDMQAK